MKRDSFCLFKIISAILVTTRTIVTIRTQRISLILIVNLPMRIQIYFNTIYLISQIFTFKKRQGDTCLFFYCYRLFSLRPFRFPLYFLFLFSDSDFSFASVDASFSWFCSFSVFCVSPSFVPSSLALSYILAPTF